MHGLTASRSWFRRACATAALAVVATMLVAVPAGAHADLVSTDPAGGSNLDAAPKAITLTFTEGVDVRADGIRLLDEQGDDVKTGSPTHPDGQAEIVEVSVPALDDGLYAVVWRGVSVDAHPVSGTFTFGVGTSGSGAAADALVAKADQAAASDSLVGALFGLTRFLGFAGMALLIGAAAFVAYLWPGDRAVPRVRRVLAIALGVAIGATAFSFLLQGPYTSGGTVADMFSGDQISAVWDSRFGKVLVLRLALLIVAGILVRVMVRHRGPVPNWWFDVAGVTGLALAATPGLAGHASTGRWVVVALPADALHVFAVSIWLGGLVMLGLAAGREGFDGVARRFSGVALVCVAVVVATGAFQAVRQVPALSDLWDTEYGRLLLIKLAIFVVLVAVAVWSRRLVHGPGNLLRPASGAPQMASTDETPEEAIDESGVGGVVAPPMVDAPPVPATRVVRGVLFELALGAAILGVTAGLVNTPPPARTASSESAGVTVVLGSGDVRLDTELLPARVGEDNELHLTAVDPDGLPVEVVDMQADLTNAERGVPPIDVPLSGVSTGHYIGQGITLPFPGEWKLSVTVFVTDVDTVEVSTPIQIG